MNSNRYRLVFNKKRGMLMAVEECATSRAKGDRAGQSRVTGTPSFAVWFAPLQALKLAAALFVGTALPVGAMAGVLPQGGTVVGGAASIQTLSPNQMVITQTTQRAAINWNSFNIGAGDSVRFAQPSASASTLNRVVGMTGSSRILGTLTANGQIYIVNPQGVVFGKGSVVNAGALLATTKNIDPRAYMTNGASQLFVGGEGTSGGLIENDGHVSVVPGGWIALVGDHVRNTGTLDAPRGKVELAAGDLATLTLSNGLLASLSLDTATANAGIESSGVIRAQGGSVLITANAANTLLDHAINLSGVLDVSGASGASGGNVTIAGGAQGAVDLSGARIEAGAAGGTGGNVTVAGHDIALTNGTTIDATGATGGGNVQVGGALHGAGSVQHAATVSMDRTSHIDASATGNGDGGTVALWSDRQTTFDGTITARGGAQGGNGGMVEASSEGTLLFNPLNAVDTSAARGAFGTLLLDPLNIHIKHGEADGNDSATADAANTTTNSSITDGQIEEELAHTNVTLTASNRIYDDGDVDITSNSNGSLSLTGYGVDLKGHYGVDGGLNINVQDTASTISGTITGNGALSLNADATFQGTLTLLGNNSYKGGTNIAHGTLQVGNGTVGGTVGTGAIVDNGSLIFDAPNDIRLTDSISGSGGVEQRGTGVLSLAGIDSYGGSTVISNGTLKIEGAGSLGKGAIVDNGHLVFSQADNATVDGDISGTGDLTQASTGSTTLDGNVALHGGIHIDSGTLQVGDGSSKNVSVGASITNNGTLVLNSGSRMNVDGSIADNGELRIDGSGQTTINGSVSGTGNLTQAGTGTTALLADNRYQGTTTIGNGSLQVGNGGKSGSLGTGSIIDNGNLTFNRSDAVTLGQVVSGNGSLTQVGNGTLALTAANNYTGATNISAGTLEVDGSGSLGRGDVTVKGNLTFNLASATTLDQNISGSGSLTQAGAGNLTLAGNNGLTGCISVSRGATLIAGRNNPALGSADVWDNGTVDLNGYNVSIGYLYGNGKVTDSHGDVTLTVGNRDHGNTFSGVIEDGGGHVSVTKIGTGTQYFSGNNAYSGGTTISCGTLSLYNGGSLGNGGVVDNADLDVLNSGTTRISNNISGNGSVSNSGAGTAILSGHNTYTGKTQVLNGTLDFANKDALYGGNTSYWTAADIIVNSGMALEVRTGNGSNDFNNNDIAELYGNLNAASGGFAGGSFFGIDTTNGDFTLNSTLGNTQQGTLGLVIDGNHALSTTTNTPLADTSVLIRQGATFDLQGRNVDVGSLQGTGCVTNNGANATLKLGSDNSNQSFGGVIRDGSGTVSLTKVGNGTQNIDGNNTYSGQTLIDGGGLGGNFGHTSEIVNNANLAFTQNGTVVFNYAYSGSGNLIQAGTGTTIVGGNSNFSGKVYVEQGTLDFATKDALYDGDTSKWTADDIHVDGGTLAVMTGSGSYGPGFTDDAITALLTNLDASSGGFAKGTSFGIDTTNGDYTLGASIRDTQQGALGLTVFGNHAVKLGGDDTFSGTAAILGGSTLDLNGHHLSVGGLDGNGTVTDGNHAAASLTFRGADPNVSWNSGYAGANWMGSIQDGNGKVSVTKVGDGGEHFGGNNTFTGGMNLSAGVLLLDPGAATLGCGTVTLSGGSIASWRSAAWGVANTTINNDIVVTANSAIGVTDAPTVLGGSITFEDGATLTIAKQGGNHSSYHNGELYNITIAGNITGDGNLVANFGQQLIPNLPGEAVGNIGAVILDGHNTYTGTTTVNGGTLEVGNGGNLGRGDVIDNGQLVFNTSAPTTDVNNVISGNGSLTRNGMGTVILTGDNTYSGGTTINCGTLQVGNHTANGSLGNGTITDNAQLVLDRTGNLTLGAINGTGSVTGTVDNGLLTWNGAVNLTGASSQIDVTAGAGMNVTGDMMVRGGDIKLTTRLGNLTVGGNLTSAGNITLDAGADGELGKDSGTDSYGDVVLAHPGSQHATTGHGKVLTIYSGNADSQNLEKLVSTDNSGVTYNKVFDSNAGNVSGDAAHDINLIYRTRPVLQIGGGVDTTRTYDGTSNVTIVLSPGNRTAQFDGDTYTFNFEDGVGYGTAENSNVGVWNVTIDSADSNASAHVTSVPLGSCVTGLSNTSFGGMSVDITKAALHVTADNVSKVYGEDDPGNDQQTYTLSGLQGADTANSALMGHLGRDSGEDVGSYDITQGNLQANGNYNLSIDLANATETITKANLTVTAQDATKTYGTDDSALNYTVSGLATGSVKSYDEHGNLMTTNLSDTQDSVLTGNLGRQQGENVRGYNVTQGSLQANGNYNLSFNSANATETITKRNLTVTAQDATKTYGTDDSVLNYAVNGLAFGSVKSYDEHGNLVATNLSDTQDLVLTGNLGRDSGEDVGSYNVTQGSLQANGNYNLSFNSANAIEMITKANLAVTAQDATKTYGTDDSALNYTVSGLATGSVKGYDEHGNLVTTNLSDTSGSVLTGNLGRDWGEEVGTYNVTQGSLQAGGNYNLSFNPANATETITKANLTVTAESATKTYGTDDSAFGYTTNGLVNRLVKSYDANGTLVTTTLSDQADSVLTGNLGRQQGENVGSYNVTQGSLQANGNYNLNFDPASAHETITKANLTVTAQDTTKTYGTDDSVLNYTVSGMVNGVVRSYDASGNLMTTNLSDTQNSVLTGNLGRQQGEDAGTYNLTAGNLRSNGNYDLTVHPAGATETITAANLTATAQNVSKIYGQSDPTLSYTVSGLADGPVRSYDASGNLITTNLSDTQGSVLTGSLNRIAGENPGHYSINAGNLASGNRNYHLVVNTDDKLLTIKPGAVTGVMKVGSDFEQTPRGPLAADLRDGDVKVIELRTDGYLPTTLIQRTGKTGGEVESSGVRLPESEQGMGQSTDSAS